MPLKSILIKKRFANILVFSPHINEEGDTICCYMNIYAP